ncbi:MAG: hypothetical protein ACO3EE_07405 [Flavobacteriales bacterium]
MTRILLSFLLLGSSLLMNAQTQPALNCFEKYAKKFEERGANTVEDGWHEGVVISIRKGSTAECIPGKVKVENGKIVSIYRQFSDGTYEETPMKKTYKSGSEITIVNGISYSMLTTEDEVINIIFPKQIKPPKKQFKAAADPDNL